MNEATANISWLPFDPRDWVQLTPAFGRLKSVVAPHGPKFTANNYAATYFDRCVHEGLLELALVAPDFTYRQFNDAERQELHIRVPLNYKEGCNIEPHYDGHWYVRRSDLEKRTAIPVTPAARAEVEHVPARTPPVSAPPAESPRRDVDAADAPVQGTQVKLGGPQLSSAAENPPKPKCQPKRKLKRKPRRKAGPGRERIYNHEAITGAGNRVLARGRPDTKALFFEKVIAECRAAKPKIKLPSNIDVDDSLLRRIVGKLYDAVKDERHN